MKSVLTSILLLSSFSALAQWGYKDEKIASRFKPGILWYNTGWKPGKEDKSRKYDRLIVDAVYTLPQGTNIRPTTAGSFGWNLNTMWDVPITKGNTFSFGWGLSYRHTRVGYITWLNQDLNLSTSRFETDSIMNADKQVIGSHTIAIPLELRFRAAKWKHVKFHLGGYFGYQMQTYNKMWLNDNQIVAKDKQLTDANPWVYGVHARLGFRNFALFGDYRLSKYFVSSGSSPLNFLSFGLSVSLF